MRLGMLKRAMVAEQDSGGLYVINVKNYQIGIKF